MESVSSRKHKFNSKNKENNDLKKLAHRNLRETRARIPFSNKNSCFNSNNLKNNGLNVISAGTKFPKTVECLTSDKELIIANNANYDTFAKVTNRRKSVGRKIDSQNKPQLTVRMQNISQEDLKLHYFRSTVDIKRISANVLRKYMRKSQVIVSNILPKTGNLNVNVTAKMEKSNKEIAHTLRKRKRINYAALFQNSSVEEVKDIYEFDSDSEDKKVNQKRIELDKSVPFERNIKAAMYRIEHNDKKKKGINISKTNNNKAWEFFGARRKKEISKPKKVAKKLNLPPRNRKVKEKANFLIDKKIVIEKPVTDNEAADNYSDDDIDTAYPVNEIEEVSCILKAPKVNILQNMIINSGEKQPDLVLSAISTNKVDTIVNKNKDLERNSNELDDLSDDDWNYFLTDQLEAPAANSTMIQPSNDPSSTPWRLTLGIARNPHFLQYKETSLPNYNQDMVINSTATEKLLSGSKTPNYTNQESVKKKQTSILSFVSSNTSILDSPDIINSSFCETLDTNKSTRKSNSKKNIENSLFDIHQLTPPKSILKSNNKSSNKENKGSPVKRRMEKVKRQILGEKTDSLLNTIIDSVQPESPNKNDKYFGFDSISDDENEKNSPDGKKNGKNGMVWLFGKPLRLDDYINFVKTSKDRVVNENFNAQNGISDKNDSTDGINNSISVHEVSSTVGIFEDLNPVNKTPVPRNYERRNKRHIRRVSTDVEDNEEEEEKPKKRKKDVRTKEEEKQAEKWAKSFNEMCQEVDQYDLEIE